MFTVDLLPSKQVSQFRAMTVTRLTKRLMIFPFMGCLKDVSAQFQGASNN